MTNLGPLVMQSVDGKLAKWMELYGRFKAARGELKEAMGQSPQSSRRRSLNCSANAGQERPHKGCASATVVNGQRATDDT